MPAFSFNGLTIVPSEIVAVSATPSYNRRSSNTSSSNTRSSNAPSSQGAPWLTLLPLSSRRDAAIGYGALPNMKTRAEMFNRLAIGINHLSSVRLIQPRVAQATTRNTTTTTYQRSPETNGAQNWVQGSVKFGGDAKEASYSINEVQISQSLSPAGAAFSMKSEAGVDQLIIPEGRTFDNSEIYAQAQLENLRLKHGDIAALKAGLYIVSTYTTADVTIKYIDHPLSKKATAHLNLKNVTEGKLIIEKFTEKGSCSTERADTEEDKPMVCGVYDDFVYQHVDGSPTCPYKQFIPVSSVPSTKKTYVTELENKKTMTVSLKANKKAERYSIPAQFDTIWREPVCISYEAVTVKPVLIDFSPKILKV